MTGTQVRMLRERCQLSLRGLARILRVHWVTIWRWEHDHHPIPLWHAGMLSLMAIHARRRPGKVPCPACHGTGVKEP